MSSRSSPATIAFRPFSEDDFPLMLEWLSRPHVKQWWDDGDDSLERVANSYSADDAIRRFVLQVDGADAGYFQHEDLAPAVIGIDVFLASVDDLNQGLGARSISAFIRMITQGRPDVSVQVDPSPSNRRAIRCFEKVGFRSVSNEPVNTETPAYVMTLAL